MLPPPPPKIAESADFYRASKALYQQLLADERLKSTDRAPCTHPPATTAKNLLLPVLPDEGPNEIPSSTQTCSLETPSAPCPLESPPSTPPSQNDTLDLAPATPEPPHTPLDRYRLPLWMKNFSSQTPQV